MRGLKNSKKSKCSRFIFEWYHLVLQWPASWALIARKCDIVSIYQLRYEWRSCVDTWASVQLMLSGREQWEDHLCATRTFIESIYCYKSRHHNSHKRTSRCVFVAAFSYGLDTDAKTLEYRLFKKRPGVEKVGSIFARVVLMLGKHTCNPEVSCEGVDKPGQHTKSYTEKHWIVWR